MAKSKSIPGHRFSQSQKHQLAPDDSRRLKEYAIWYYMVIRCHDPRNPQWLNYGGRGIIVCERWLKSFKAFYADMGPRPSSDYSLDRRDNDGPYSPANCRWVTKKEQQRNTRYHRKITWQGKTLCLAEWADITGIPHTTIWARLDVLGWSAEEALTKPVQKQARFRKRITRDDLESLFSEHGSWKKVAAVIGCIPQALLRFRRDCGMHIQFRCDSPHPPQ